MSELTDRLTRMLTQAQTFAKDAPLEAVSRAKVAKRTAEEALHGLSGEERDDVTALLTIASARVERYQAVFDGWSNGVRERAAEFLSNERERLQNPLPSKI